MSHEFCKQNFFLCHLAQPINTKNLGFFIFSPTGSGASVCPDPLNEAIRTTVQQKFGNDRAIDG